MDKVNELLLSALYYRPYVYTQTPTELEGVFQIQYPFDEIPNRSLLFILPTINSADSAITDNILRICRKTTDETGAIQYVTTDYTIYVESTDGIQRKASLGSIIANRLCVFRFIPNNTTACVLVNSPQYNSIAVENLTVVQGTVFKQVPVYETSEGTQKELALEETVAALTERVKALEEKFQFGSASPDEFFAENISDGVIYGQIQELDET